jgi:predicted DNA-binding transcriptional regulator YafY
MSRAARLLELLQLLRRHKSPLSGSALAAELGISIRTLYRDIATLQAQGADIQGEPGLGYVLRPGFTLPPLMFSAEELEALALGARWVRVRGDTRLGPAAENAVAKIRAVLPKDMRDNIDAATMTVHASSDVEQPSVDVSIVRRAIRDQHKLLLTYRDGANTSTQRFIWPLLVGVFDRVLLVAAWCELRKDYRAFRVDRMLRLDPTDDPFPRGRGVMLKEWREKQGISTTATS